MMGTICMAARPTPRAGDLCAPRLRQFRAAEDGAILPLTLFMVVLFLAMAGFGIDTMRHEMERTRLQATLDRAVLAGASALDAEGARAVVEDYFDKAGLASYLHAQKDGDITTTLNAARVSASAGKTFDTFLMRLAGVDELTAQAAATAEVRIPKVEISLVLDISGSMRFTDSSGVPQIDIMRPAAQGFIQRVLAEDRKELTSLSIVPYAGGVNPGQRVFDLLGGAGDHAFSHCMEIAQSDFGDPGLPTAASAAQLPHFMYWPIATAFMDWGWCPSEDASIRYFKSDIDELSDFVEDVRLHDGTGTHFGIKWGLALLDPGSQWLTNQLIAANEVEAKFADRPAAWSDADTLKVIVLMTDGAITQQWRPHDPDDPINATQHLQGKSPGAFEWTGKSTNRSRFFDACDEAKARGVTIYTIAFNTTSSSAANEMRTCASSLAHYYNVTSVRLTTAFQSIAGSIQTLRLTQ